MEFPLASGLASRLVVLAETNSTNDDLADLAEAGDALEFTVVATTSQTAGRGRLGRAWAAPPGTSLAASVLLRPQDSGVQLGAYGWIPLIAGLAMTRAVRALAPDRQVALKWPNDVQIGGLKVCGVLSELLPDGQSVIAGAGLNLTISAEALPVPTATSLTLNGVSGSAAALADRALAGYLGELRQLWVEFTAAVAEGALSGIRTSVSEACATLGQEVRVELPDGTQLRGKAIDLDEAGRLRISIGSNGAMQTVAAGDVTHLRYE